jgi:hypothetical protein
VTHRAHRRPLVDGRWGSRPCSERGCSRRLSSGPAVSASTAPSTRAALSTSKLLPSRCGHRALDPCGYHDGGSSDSVRACEHRRPRVEPARRSSSRRAALAGRDGAGNRKLWGWLYPVRGSHHYVVYGTKGVIAPGHSAEEHYSTPAHSVPARFFDSYYIMADTPEERNPEHINLKVKGQVRRLATCDLPQWPPVHAAPLNSKHGWNSKSAPVQEVSLCTPLNPSTRAALTAEACFCCAI